jgi:DNA helicase-2/ATP-dependent DNA helicase PcrA
MKYSKFQENIFSAVVNTNYNISIVATAGAGKTFSAIECLKLIPKLKKSIFLSFSNVIVNDLKEKIPSHVRASTLHSMGCRMVMNYYKGIKINEKKFFNLALKSYKKSEWTKETYKECYNIQDITNFVRMTLTPLDVESIIEMCSYYGIDWSEETILKSIELIERDFNPKVIDFADMIYIPATNPQIIDEVFDYIFLDEAQDINNAQLKFLENLKKISGRLIAFGDLNQAIYSFSGSSIDSFQKIIDMPNTISLPLSVNYRCGKNIVNEARKVYTDIIAYEGSIDGIVRVGDIEEITEGDMVIARNNAPLISLYFYLIGKSIKAHLVGKEIERGILDLAKSVLSTSRDKVIAGLKVKLTRIEKDLEKLKMNKPRNHPRYLAMYEKVEILLLILSKIDRPNDLVKKIEEIFNENKEGCKLLSCHRSKGLESDRIFFIQRYNGQQLIPSKYARKDWEKVQENNLLFVGLTRAKKELVYIDYDDEELE